MPIIDYKLKSEQAEKNFFDNPDISKANKDAVTEFLTGWKVKRGEKKGQPISYARRNIFFKQISHLLINCKNIKKDMNSRDTINEIFTKLSKELSTSYYGTVVNVSLSLVRRLNDGDKPSGFKDIDNLGKKSQLRHLKESDMVEWTEGILLAKQSPSIQFKAIIMMQLDGGFRPSEFIDLKYGSISKDGKFLVASVAGKTGRRDVVLYRSVPFVQRWLQNHPTKKDSDPLWIMEHAQKSHKSSGNKKIRGYDYFAITKRIRGMAEKAQVNKPVDFYNLRHSACRLAKLENLPHDLAAEKFGHSVDYYINTYARLSRKDKLNRHRKATGEMVDEEASIDKPILCSVCDTVNQPKTSFCDKCGNALTLAIALKEEKSRDKELTDLKKEMQQIRDALQIKKLIKN